LQALRGLRHLVPERNTVRIAFGLLLGEGNERFPKLISENPIVRHQLQAPLHEFHQLPRIEGSGRGLDSGSIAIPCGLDIVD